LHRRADRPSPPAAPEEADRIPRHRGGPGEGRFARNRARASSGVEGLIHEYSLSSQEGVALMCLAEALLRIPDAATRERADFATS